MSPVLQHYNNDAHVELHTDASGDGIGAVLAHHADDSMEHVMAYVSHTLSKAERNYFATKKECLAIVWVVGGFPLYLYDHPFKVMTDHHALC